MVSEVKHRWPRLSAVRAGCTCLLVALAVDAQAGSLAGKDTITVDGTALRLDLDLRESAPLDGAVGESAQGRGLSPWARPDWHLSIGAAGASASATAQGKTLAAVAGRPIRPLGMLEMSWTWSQDGRLLRLGLAGGAREWWTYDVTNLDDSLYAVSASVDGGLEQWTQRTYDLGIELDTIPLPVTRRLGSLARISLERGGEFGGPRQNPWRWWAGLHLEGMRVARQSREAERLPLSGTPQGESVVGPDRADWVALNTLGWGIQLGVEHAFDSRWSWAFRSGWTAGARSGAWAAMALSLRMGK